MIEPENSWTIEKQTARACYSSRFEELTVTIPGKTISPPSISSQSIPHNTNVGKIVATRFIKFIPSEEADYLQEIHPNAFLLLCLIAKRARRIPGQSDGLEIGEAHIGDYKKAGIDTRKKYRTALSVLVSRGILIVVDTCRTRGGRKRATEMTTTRATNKLTIGTLVRILKSNIWDINITEEGHRNDDHKGQERATEGPPKGHEQERIRRDISSDISKEDAQTAKRLRTKDSLSFDFEKWEFVGITEKDLADWKLMYPHIDLNVQILEAAQWLKNNPTRNNKKLWRKYLTGWFRRANDKIENQKAYRSASGGSAQDRRTKDINGNPVESPHTGRF